MSGLHTDETKNGTVNGYDPRVKAQDLESPPNEEYHLDTGSVQDIKEKSLSWQQTASLLLLEYIVLAILSFPYTFATLGMAGGVIATLLIGLITLYTSHLLWRYCMAYPLTRDICDVAYNLAHGGKWGRIAWWASFAGLVLNNVFIMGLHSVAGSVALNTLSAGAVCTQVFAVVITLAMFFGSLLRDLRHMSILGLIAAGTMFIALLLAMIFSGVQKHPAGYDGTPVTIRAWAAPGTSFVAGVSAVLNITYTYVGQILIPSYIADMKNPADFPKALYVSMLAELILFTLGGAVIYSQVGNEYVTSPAYGALIPKYSKTVAAWVLPTIVIIGCIYSLVTARVIFFQLFDHKSVHRRQHTVKGWGTWVLITVILWIAAYIIGQAVPFFGDLLSLISSLFDSWYGFIFWGFAYFELQRGQWFKGLRNSLESLLNVLVLIVGFFFLGAGTYASVQSIIDSYATGAIKTPFQCTNNGF